MGYKCEADNCFPIPLHFEPQYRQISLAGLFVILSIGDNSGPQPGPFVRLRYSDLIRSEMLVGIDGLDIFRFQGLPIF